MREKENRRGNDMYRNDGGKERTVEDRTGRKDKTREDVTGEKRRGRTEWQERRGYCHHTESVWEL